jgi:hypothetical protein
MERGIAMKRQLTAEQTAKRDERRAKFKALWKQVAAMPELERVHLAAQYGFRTVEGRELSLCNSMLIALQLPGASVLGGFRQWIKAGRCVRKGQHGAMIWVPTGCRKAGEPAESPINGSPVPDGEGQDTRFMIGTVFDIAQTEESKGQGEENAAGVPCGWNEIEGGKELAR